MNAVSSILAAIIYRERTGEGQFIDVSMQDSIIPFNSMDGAAYFAGGPMPARENGLLNGGGIYDFYETADGKYMSVGSLEPKFFAALCDGMGHPEWRDGKILRTEPEMVKEVFRSVFKTRTRDEWTEVFRDLDACVEPVMDLEEVSNDEHLVRRGMWPEVEVPLTDHISVRQMGCPMHLSKCPPAYRHAGYPEGFHTEEILSSLGYSQEEIKELI
jgi:crotonobetainyl-CoA:carnitine CoA-transferase CaiB-like acyl-CoA transferase